MGPSHTRCVMYQTPTVVSSQQNMAIFYLPQLLDPGKKSLRSTGLERPTSKTKIYVLLFFWWNFLVQTFQDLHDFLHDFFKTPVGWSFLTTTVSAPRRPRRPRYTFGMLYGKPLILQQTLTPPQWMSRPPFPVFMDHGWPFYNWSSDTIHRNGTRRNFNQDSNLFFSFTALFKDAFLKEYEMIWDPLRQRKRSSSPTTLMLCKCLRTICMEYLESHRPSLKYLWPLTYT